MLPKKGLMEFGVASRVVNFFLDDIRFLNVDYHSEGVVKEFDDVSKARSTNYTNIFCEDCDLV
jgi:hypothetical protein